MRNVFASSGGGNHSSGKTIQEKGTKCLFNEERGEVEEQEEEGCIIRMQLGKRETFAKFCHSLAEYYTKKFRSSKVHMNHHNSSFWILSSNPAPSGPTSLFPPPLSLFSSPFDAGIRGGFNAPFFFPLPSSHGDFSSDISISLSPIKWNFLTPGELLEAFQVAFGRLSLPRKKSPTETITPSFMTSSLLTWTLSSCKLQSFFLRGDKKPKKFLGERERM